MKLQAYIHSLKDHANNLHVLGEAEIIEKIGDNLYLAEYNGTRCTAIFNPFVGGILLTMCMVSKRRIRHARFNC